MNHANIKDALHNSIGKQDAVLDSVVNVANPHSTIHAPLPGPQEDSPAGGHGMLGKPGTGFFHILGPEPVFGDYFKTVEESELAFNQLFTLHPDLMTQTAIGKPYNLDPDVLARAEAIVKNGDPAAPEVKAARYLLAQALSR
ncbi:hypothetical protein ACGFX4_40475 [Kitasatospora sp. NPDC048365]|uniref:hypothetical protein n=1 Tax=Kitasatospora sp. NPDC048365 TaxID=3364050 RepID=UPI003711D493